MSTWVLNRRLEGVAENGPSVDARGLAAAVLAARRKGSPADSLLFTPDLALEGCLPANDLLSNSREASRSYLAHLARKPADPRR